MASNRGTTRESRKSNQRHGRSAQAKKSAERPPIPTHNHPSGMTMQEEEAERRKEIGNCTICGTTIKGWYYGSHEGRTVGTCSKECETEYGEKKEAAQKENERAFFKKIEIHTCRKPAAIRASNKK